MTDDEILIRLKRQYSKDEYVSVLLKQIKEKDFEIGVLTSERDEATDLYNDLLKQKELFSEINKEARIRLKTDANYQNLKSEIKRLKEIIKDQKQLRDDLFFKLNNKK